MVSLNIFTCLELERSKIMIGTKPWDTTVDGLFGRVFFKIRTDQEDIQDFMVSNIIKLWSNE